MKIELKNPFLEEYKAAYVVINKEPRRVCILVRKDNSKTSMSYARYLMTCHLNRFLEKHEHVDHIDNDKMNDTIENYQILSQTQNNIKSKNPRKTAILICPICKKSFVRFHNQISHKNNPTCSRKCGGIKSHIK